MQTIVPHEKGQLAAKSLIDKSIQPLIESIPTGSVKISELKTEWDNNTLLFSFKGKKGIFSSTIHGTVQVDEKDITVNVDLPGIVKHFVNDDQITAAIQAKAKQILA